MSRKVDIEPGWHHVLQTEFSAEYFAQLISFIRSEIEHGKQIFPPGPLIFNAFAQTPFSQVKVVILGQDPYHGPGQAHGLCFSVPKGVTPPPSLINIYTEMQHDLDISKSLSGDLSKWAHQGVLLLNAVLTVEAGKAASHQGKGWEQFTDAAIQALNEQKEHLVFMLWGSYAKTKGRYLNRSKHLVLESGHPSPLSANRGHWFGHGHFSKCNHYLAQHKLDPINWNLT